GSGNRCSLGTQQAQPERLDPSAVEHARAIAEHPEPIDWSSLRVGELAIHAGGRMNLLKHLGHGKPNLIAGVPLKPVEHFPSHDLFTGTRNQPMIEKNRGSRIPKPANADFRFPEAGLEFLPVVLVRILDVSTCFK